MRSIFTVGMPTPTGTLCPSLPQMPMPSSSFRSWPTMLTYFSASGPLPISDAPRTGRVNLAVFDQVALGGGEDEVAAGDVHLPAAERGAVEPLGNAADDFRRIAFARQHEGIGHARHGDVLIAFAPSAAGGGGFQQSRRKLVLQIAAQNSVFDQDIALRGLAFVVDVERTAPAANGAVVDHRAERTGHLLADRGR